MTYRVTQFIPTENSANLEVIIVSTGSCKSEFGTFNQTSHFLIQPNWKSTTTLLQRRDYNDTTQRWKEDNQLTRIMSCSWDRISLTSSLSNHSNSCCYECQTTTLEHDWNNKIPLTHQCMEFTRLFVHHDSKWKTTVDLKESRSWRDNKRSQKTGSFSTFESLNKVFWWSSEGSWRTVHWKLCKLRVHAESLCHLLPRGFKSKIVCRCKNCCSKAYQTFICLLFSWEISSSR